MRRAGISLLLLSLAISASAGAQTADTLWKERPLFRTSDAVLAVGFIAAAAAAAPADKYFTHQLREPARQANRFLGGGATAFRIFGSPGGLIAGGSMYLIGLGRGSRRVEDLGLHTVESILIGSVVAGGIKVVAGRARPYADTANAANFQLMRGLKSDDYRSLPSGHSTAAFAFASIISAETSHWWPHTKWIVGPVVYGAATLTGVSRIYNNDHWASDVITGAAIGTLTGIKVFRYQHSHPDNHLDKLLLRAGVQAMNDGSWALTFSTAPR